MKHDDSFIHVPAAARQQAYQGTPHPSGWQKDRNERCREHREAERKHQAIAGKPRARDTHGRDGRQ